MRFLFDENVDYRLAAFIIQFGHNVTVISHDYPYGLEDQHVLAIAIQERRILITNDKDYGELIFLQNLPHHGVILFRLKPEEVTIQIIQERVLHVLSHYKSQLDQFIVVTKEQVRVRTTSKQPNLLSIATLSLFLALFPLLCQSRQ